MCQEGAFLKGIKELCGRPFLYWTPIDLLFTNSVMASKLLNLSEPRVTHLKSENNDKTVGAVMETKWDMPEKRKTVLDV